MIRPARPDEADRLSALAYRSKAHWGYEPEQMEVFRGELTLAPDAVPASHAHVHEERGALQGFYSLADLGGGRIELEHLFVDPEALRQGIGARLFHHACGVAHDQGADTLFIQSDPNAAGFYRTLGAIFVADVPSSVPGRTLPTFEFALATAGSP